MTLFSLADIAKRMCNSNHISGSFPIDVRRREQFSLQCIRCQKSGTITLQSSDNDQKWRLQGSLFVEECSVSSSRS